MPAVKRPFQDITASAINRQDQPTNCKHRWRIQHSLGAQSNRNLPFNRHSLSRSLLGVSPYTAECADLALDTLGLHCRPSDVKEVLFEDSLHIPFAVAAANTCSLGAVADEPGIVRLFDHTAYAAASKSGTGSTNPPEVKALFSLPMHNNAIFDLAWSPDDRLLATASGAQTIQLLDVQTQTVLAVLHGHTSTVKRVVFDPGNGNRLVSVGRDGKICIWDMRQADPSSYATDGNSRTPVQAMDAAHGHTDSVKHASSSRRAQVPAVSITSLALLPFGNIMTSGAGNANLLTWDPRSFPSWTGVPTTHQARTRLLSKTLVGKTADAPGKHLRAYGVAAMTLSKDKSIVYAMSRDNKISAYATSHPEAPPLHTWQIPGMRVDSFYCKMDISQEGFLACGNTDGSPVIVDTRYKDSAPIIEDIYKKRTTPMLARTLSELSQIASAPPAIKATSAPMQQHGYRLLQNAHKAECTGVSWSHDGQALLTVGDDCMVRVWRQDLTGKARRERLACDMGEQKSWGYM